MRRITNWFEWKITTKILVPFLGLSIVAITIMGYIAFTSLQGLGQHALSTSASLGESAISNSTAALNNMGENTIRQVAKDIARQIEIYLETRPAMTLTEMRNDTRLREIVVQPVGTTGYTTLIDTNNSVIVIHKFPGQEKDVSSLESTLPAFWSIVEASTKGKAVSGYYDWQEVDGSISQKYASIVPIHTADSKELTLWATTYIDEFSMPAEELKGEINTAIQSSSNFINDNVASMQRSFIMVFILLMVVVTGISLLLSRVITRPIIALKQGAESIGRGELDYKLVVKNRDELGNLADSFNNMGLALRNNIAELETTAAENITKEKEIQDNLRLYAQKVGQAQEAERKRIARELHDETVQDLVVVTRHLEDLADGKSNLTAEDIRNEITRILEGVRNFSQELRHPILEHLGLVPAVNWLASDLTNNYGITTDIKVKGEPHQLPPETELMLFRIIQEALTNVRKHAGADHVILHMVFSEAGIKVVIRDNGTGFIVPTRLGNLTENGKLGLAGMEERVQLIGGKVSIKSSPTDGTSLTIEAPH
jgi:two-component system, NarL family, sensor histidine kinase DegS